MEVWIGGNKVPVASFKEASQKWRAYRDEEGIGASGMVRHDGDIVQGGKVVARVSYNGRVWDKADNEIIVK